MQKIGTLFGKIISWAVVLVLIVFTVYPVIYALLGSLKTNAELTLGNSILPAVPQWQNYYTGIREEQPDRQPCDDGARGDHHFPFRVYSGAV